MVYVVSLAYSPREPKFDFDDEPPGCPLLGISAGHPIEDLARFPTSATQRNDKPMCDVFSLPGMNWVSARFRDLVETFEPGVHQFVPIVLKAPDGTPHPGAWYMFNCTQSFDAVLAAESSTRLPWRGAKTVDIWNGLPWASIGSMVEKTFTFSRPKVGGRHLWVGQFIGEGDLLVSGAFGRAVKTAKIKYLDMREELDSDTP